MKILIINDYATLTGGAEFLVLSLRDGLRKRGHDARLFASSARPLGKRSLADYECFGTLSRVRIFLQTFNPWAWFKLRRVLREFKPDVVHVTIALTQLSPLILPLLRNIPTVHNAQWYRTICPTGTKILPNGESCRSSMGFVCYKKKCLPIQDWLLLSLQMALVRRWFYVFDRVAAASYAVARQLASEGIEASSIIWNGIPYRHSRQSLAEFPTCVFAGRLVWEKGIDVLLKAFSVVLEKLPEAKLLVAGDGPERKILEQLTLNLNIEDGVSFLGHLSRSDLEEHFAQAWVQVIPSRWAEPFGLVAAEAQMRGTAVIASRSGGLTEVVREPDTGILVPPGEVVPLASALDKVLSDRKLAEKMGQHGRERALSSFSEDSYVDSFLNLYREISSTPSAKETHIYNTQYQKEAFKL